MKRVTCVLLALLCLFVSALAESVPSKNTADMVTVAVDQTLNPNIPQDSGFEVVLVQNEDATKTEEFAAHVAACQQELQKIVDLVNQNDSAVGSSAVETYFGEIKDSEGNAVVLSDVLGSTTLNVNEFIPVVISNYDQTYGNVTMSFQFQTPYAQDEHVVIMIGIVDPETGEIVWTAFEGIGMGEDGAVQVEFTPEILLAIQNKVSLLAVVSSGEAVQQ